MGTCRNCNSTVCNSSLPSVAFPFQTGCSWSIGKFQSSTWCNFLVGAACYILRPILLNSDMLSKIKNELLTASAARFQQLSECQGMGHFNSCLPASGGNFKRVYKWERHKYAMQYWSRNSTLQQCWHFRWVTDRAGSFVAKCLMIGTRSKSHQNPSVLLHRLFKRVQLGDMGLCSRCWRDLEITYTVNLRSTYPLTRIVCSFKLLSKEALSILSLPSMLFFACSQVVIKIQQRSAKNHQVFLRKWSL